MRISVIIIFGLIAAGGWGLNPTHAQDDVVELAKTFPPRFLDSSEMALASISWQLELKLELMNRYSQQKDRLSFEAEANTEKLKYLASQLPPEVRFVDKTVRSRLIGKTMEELLDARLELASRQSVVGQLTEMLAKGKDSKQAKLINRQAKMAIEAARLRMGAAEAEYENSKRLTIKGSKANRESGMSENAIARDNRIAEYTIAITRIELEGAMLQAEVEGGQQNSEVAQRLTDARIEIAPTQARIAAAEKFLKTFVDSAKMSAEIEQAQRQADNWQQDIRALADEAFRLKQEVEELSVLRSRIEQGLKMRAPKKEDSKKDQ